MSLLSFIKMENRRGEQVLPGRWQGPGEVWYSGKGEEVGKVCGR
jgi:hypothetical protein